MEKAIVISILNKIPSGIIFNAFVIVSFLIKLD